MYNFYIIAYPTPMADCLPSSKTL